jgi:xylan 1,4-beta-xylosidase
VVKTPFYGGFGLIAAGGIPKPSYHAFRLLHKLGDRRIPLNSESALLTLRSDGTVVLAVWNYASPDQPGATRAFIVHFKNTKAQQAQVWRLDSNHGDVHPPYEKMGAPKYPTQAELTQLRSASEITTPETSKIKNGELMLDVPAHGLQLVELK